MNTALWVRIAEALFEQHWAIYQHGKAQGLTAAEFTWYLRAERLQSLLICRIHRDPHWLAVYYANRRNLDHLA